MSDAASVSGRRVSCPVCARPVKIARRGLYASHGFTRASSRCRASGLPVVWSRAELAAMLERHADAMLDRAADAERAGRLEHAASYRDSAATSSAAAARLRAP